AADTVAPVSSPRVRVGVVHKLPGDLRTALIANPTALDAWPDITPLAQRVHLLGRGCQAGDDPATPYPPDPRGACRRPASALLPARMQAPRARRQIGASPGELIAGPDTMAMSFGKGCSLKNHENNKPC